ncbi:hypothetical protein NKH77_09180 [Streptomyces sp. M19]
MAVHNAVHDAGPLELAEHYNDLAPRWTHFPSTDYRLSVGSVGYRAYGERPNTDQTVFDPRVWDQDARVRWIRLLREVRPRVVLISTVSPGHRYALDMAGLAKIEVPGTYVILGGRHVDETVHLPRLRDPAKETVLLAPSSTLTVMDDGRVPRVVDAVVSGEAYHAVDLLMRSVALAADLRTHWVDPAAVGPALTELLRSQGPPAGRSLAVLAGATTGPPTRWRGRSSTSPRCPRRTRRSPSGRASRSSSTPPGDPAHRARHDLQLLPLPVQLLFRDRQDRRWAQAVQGDLHRRGAGVRVRGLRRRGALLRRLHLLEREIR